MPPGGILKAKQASARAAAAPAAAAALGKYASAPNLIAPLIPTKQSRDTDSALSGDDSEEDDDVSALSAESAAGGIFPMYVSQKDVMSVVGVALLATAGLAAAAAAIVAAPSAAVILMGGVCMVNVPAMGKKQLDIAKSSAVRTSVNMIREEIGVLEGEVNFLEQRVNELQIEANLLKEVESRLQMIAKEQGTNVNSMVELVNENQLLLDKIRRNLKQKFVTLVTGIVIKSDADGDMKICLKELPLLSLRLSMHLKELGMELDVGMFEDMIREDNDITNVIKFCADVLYAEDADSRDDNENEDSEATVDLEAFCQTLDDEDAQKFTITRQERFRMVRLSAKYTRGSVAAARGRSSFLAKQTFKTFNDRSSLREAKVKEVKRRQSKIKRLSNESQETIVTLGGLVIIRGATAEC